MAKPYSYSRHANYGWHCYFGLSILQQHPEWSATAIVFYGSVNAYITHETHVTFSSFCKVIILSYFQVFPLKYKKITLNNYRFPSLSTGTALDIDTDINFIWRYECEKQLKSYQMIKIKLNIQSWHTLSYERSACLYLKSIQMTAFIFAT